MSGNMRNQPLEGQGNPGRATKDMEQQYYEGFEGMNYEQRRQPYTPQDISNQTRQEISNDRNGEREKEI